MAEQPQQGREVIQFGRKELDPEEEKQYREKIAQARAGGGVNSLKGSTPLGHVQKPQNVPILAKGAVSQATGLQADGSVAPRPPGSPVLSSQTQQQLEQLQKAQQGEAPASEAKPELDEEELRRAAKDEEMFDTVFDFAARNEAERVLNNRKRKKEIEERCEPMNFEDLLWKNEVHQKVPIIPEKFEPTFRSFSPEESLFIKKMMSREEVQNDNYVLEKYSLCQITCSLVAINGKPLPDHRDQTGEPDTKLFQEKLKSIMKKSAYIVADLMLNYAWFDIRVRKLLNPDEVKNG